MKIINKKELKLISAGYSPGLFEVLWYVEVDSSWPVFTLFNTGVFFSAVYVTGGNNLISPLGAFPIAMAIELGSRELKIIKNYEEQSNFCSSK